MAIIGLDISTSCTGVCVLNDDGTYHSIYHVDLKGEKSFYKKVDKVRETLINITEQIEGPHKFFVEAPLLVFKMKASMASTIALLQRFNASVCYSIYTIYDQEPVHISVISARKAVGLTLPKKKKKADIKPTVFNYVRSLHVIPETEWAYKKTGKPKDWVYDRCDAYVIAAAGHKLNEQNKSDEKKEL